MDQMIQSMASAYQGMSAEEILGDMQVQGADQMFVDPWMVASYIAHLASVRRNAA